VQGSGSLGRVVKKIGQRGGASHRTAECRRFFPLMKTMKVWGVGPLWGALSLAYGAAVTFCSLRYEVGRIPPSFAMPAVLVGACLLAMGLPLYAAAGKAIFRGFPEGRLLTDGVYGLCRHPIYGSWIVLIIPGLELVLRSWLGLTTSLVAYALLRVLARREEEYLAAKFGEAYQRYRASTPFVLPLGFLRRRS
jgi:protein-S-isoprenylcysteine O-methyltransferase Ste14